MPISGHAANDATPAPMNARRDTEVMGALIVPAGGQPDGSSCLQDLGGLPHEFEGVDAIPRIRQVAAEQEEFEAVQMQARLRVDARHIAVMKRRRIVEIAVRL